ncbi:MAG: YicC family protein [Desulfomonile tiedjei]|nr:YicC family protein [Desulfomonile tiedjei]
MTTEVEIITEIRAVNHRFLDISVRVPKLYTSFEPQIRKIVSERISRGKIDVTVTRTGGKGGLMDVMLDSQLADGYYKCLLELKERYGLAGEITVSDMLTLRELIVPLEKEQGIEGELPLAQASLGDALDALDEMRKTEGRALWKDIAQRLASILEMAGLIAPLVDQVTASAKEKLAKRVQDLTGGLELDEERLIQEVALMADRSDVTEELTRLNSHVKQFLACGEEGSPLGRKLDFLLQELLREVNTVGSKSASTDIATYVVNMKAELEKIREQTQNIE